MNDHPSSPDSPAMLALGTPAGHSSLAGDGYKFLAGWEGFKAVYRAAVVSSVKAYDAYYTALSAPDPQHPQPGRDPIGWAADYLSDPTTAPEAPTRPSWRELAKLFAVYEGMQEIVRTCRFNARIAWGDEAEAALYTRLYDETIQAAHGSSSTNAAGI